MRKNKKTEGTDCKHGFPQKRTAKQQGGPGTEEGKKLHKEHLGCEAVNLGTGKGVSVLDLVKGMGEATGKPVSHEISLRRSGDVAACHADPAAANKLLGWKATLGVKEMCEDTWRWQSTNPHGHKTVVEEVENS